MCCHRKHRRGNMEGCGLHHGHFCAARWLEKAGGAFCSPRGMMRWPNGTGGLQGLCLPPTPPIPTLPLKGALLVLCKPTPVTRNCLALTRESFCFFLSFFFEMVSCTVRYCGRHNPAARVKAAHADTHTCTHAHAQSRGCVIAVRHVHQT